MNHDNPQSLVRPLPFRNLSDEVVPAFAVMTVLGVTLENGVAFLQCGKPDATLRGQLAINGPQDVGIGRRGTCQRGGDVRALLDASGDPIAGESWGIKPGQWKLARYFPGCTLQGVIDPTHRIARVECHPIDRLLVRTTAAVSADAASAAYRVYVGPFGSETDAGFTSVPLARNRGAAIPADQWAHLVWTSGHWELRALSGATMVAVPPCGLGIAGRTGDTPGHAECCLFSLDADGELAPLLNGEGQLTRAKVYNVREQAIPALAPPGERYLLVHADPSGRWVCEVPDGADGGGGSATTTTTAAPTTTTSPLPICAGTAKWTWSEEDQAWSLADNGCLTGVVSTTDEPTSTTTTTTAAPSSCLCPTTSTPTTTTTSGDPSSTTSSTTSTSTSTTSTTTSTTTTTPEPCQPVYPSFCGREDGECTFTSCASGSSTPDIDCTTTTTSTTPEGTTTTCDCNTTTTLPPPPECTHCEWYHHPIIGYVQTYNGCGGECFCGPAPDIGECGSGTAPCVTTTTTPPPGPPPCTGKCHYICVPGEGWYFVSSSCATNTEFGCSCIPPTVACDECAAPLTVGCQSPPRPTTTTTAAPCAHCYTTSTTSTTTTPNPCGDGCLWQGSTDGAWTKSHDFCAESCECQKPAYDARESCESAHTPCLGTTTTTGGPTTTTTSTTSTTTSTTSTTTTTPEPYYCGVPGTDTGDCETGNTCFQLSDAELSFCLSGGTCTVCDGSFASLALCEASELCTPTTTTPQPTTTTTTTCDPNFSCGGECSIVCGGTFPDHHYIIYPIDSCGGAEINCGCSSDVANLYHPTHTIGSPCTPPEGPFLFPCCNPCEGATGPTACNNITTTTPAP